MIFIDLFIVIVHNNYYHIIILLSYDNNSVCKVDVVNTAIRHEVTNDFKVVRWSAGITMYTRRSDQWDLDILCTSWNPRQYPRSPISVKICKIFFFTDLGGVSVDTKTWYRYHSMANDFENQSFGVTSKGRPIVDSSSVISRCPIKRGYHINTHTLALAYTAPRPAHAHTRSNRIRERTRATHICTDTHAHTDHSVSSTEYAFAHTHTHSHTLALTSIDVRRAKLAFEELLTYCALLRAFRVLSPYLSLQVSPTVDIFRVTKHVNISLSLLTASRWTCP